MDGRLFPEAWTCATQGDCDFQCDQLNQLNRTWRSWVHGSDSGSGGSQKAPCKGKPSKRPDSTWAGLSSSQESLRRFLPRHSAAQGSGNSATSRNAFWEACGIFRSDGMVPNHSKTGPPCRLPLVGPEALVGRTENVSSQLLPLARSSRFRSGRCQGIGHAGK
jgi:hypothetical protein